MVPNRRPSKPKCNFLGEQTLLIVELGKPEVLACAVKFLNLKLIANGIGGKAAACAVRQCDLNRSVRKAEKSIKVEISAKIDLLRVTDRPMFPPMRFAALSVTKSARRLIPLPWSLVRSPPQSPVKVLWSSQSSEAFVAISWLALELEAC